MDKINEVKRQHKRSLDKKEDEEDFLSCGASKKRVEDLMEKEQSQLFNERQNARGFDPYSYIDPDKYHLGENWEHEINKYSREAQMGYQDRYGI